MLAFDTHKAVKALTEAGFDDTQAEAVVATVSDAIGGDVASKADVAVLKADVAVLKADVAVLKDDVAVLKADVVGLKADVADIKADVAGVKVQIGEFKGEIYRHLWLMAASIVGLTVSLTVTLVKLID